ncbi:hypothetical protein ABZ725_30010 [Streptomyces sp. NPDC006872]|uniref:hypothetical protein n=1 Tax=Streptomyces sp. NPDC006872 TaxID=3155720 RepID=UPI0033F94C54
MSTGVIIALIVIVIVAVMVVAAVRILRARGGSHGGRGLKHRFGPEYDRAVARHDGDVGAAERELDALVQRHGELRERPLEPAERERFQARWRAAQEKFVDSPREAVADADHLLAEVAGARGFPDGGEHEEQLAALSVHHANHVDGYRRVHGAAHAAGTDDGRAPGTEDMRTAMVEARALFDDLVGSAPQQPQHQVQAKAQTKDSSRFGRHLPWNFPRHQAKES